MKTYVSNAGAAGELMHCVRTPGWLPCKFAVYHSDIYYLISCYLSIQENKSRIIVKKMWSLSASPRQSCGWSDAAPGSIQQEAKQPAVQRMDALFVLKNKVLINYINLTLVVCCFFTRHMITILFELWVHLNLLLYWQISRSLDKNHTTFITKLHIFSQHMKPFK